MSEGLTNNAQQRHMRSTKHINHKLGKRADYIKFNWVEFMSKEYFAVIKAINECYRKMLEIGKCCWVRRRYCLAGITKLGERVAKNTKLE